MIIPAADRPAQAAHAAASASSSSHTTYPYRLQRGTRLANVPPPADAPVPPLASLDGPFQLAEYLALQVRHDPHNVKRLVDVPGDDDGEAKAAERNIWIYEHLRRLPIDLTPLLTCLLQICSRESCPEMKADQWLYFCAAHPSTEECCAIDYILHTVDSTTALLNSSQQFPSRLSIPPASLAHFPSIFRRLSRIFAHAYFHHREAFSLAESETSLYARFVALCEQYQLVGSNLLVIPSEAIGASYQEEEEDSEEEEEEEESEEEEEDDDDEGRGRRGDKADARDNAKRTRSLDRPNSTAGDLPPPRSLTPAAAEAAGRGEEESDRRGASLARTGRGTLGRGKQPRGTMLWTSEAATALGADLTRTESNDTAVLIEDVEKEGQTRSPEPADPADPPGDPEGDPQGDPQGNPAEE